MCELGDSLQGHDSHPEALLLGVACDSLLLGEVLPLCFLFLLLGPSAALSPCALLLVRALVGTGVSLPVCTQQ